MVMETTAEQTKEGSQRHQIRGLFLWVILLTLSQALTLALLFNIGPLPNQTQAEKACPVLSQEITMLKDGPSSKVDLLPWKVGMISNLTLLIPKDNKYLEIQKDGRYFLYAQVTLHSSAEAKSYTVTVSQGQRTLLERRITKTKANESSTTGYLGKQVLLSTGKTITVTCNPSALIEPSDIATYLGVHLLEPS